MKATVAQFVENVHMGLGHEGLELLLKNIGINVQKLDESQLVMCMNTKGDKLKVIGGKGMVIGYLRMPNGQRIMKDALRFLPRTFGASGFNYDEACEHALMERLGKNKPAHTSPLDAARALKAS